MELTAALIDELVHRARDASRHAYAPYSRFHVGAAVLADGSAIHTGANVENASYGLSICAERSAIFRAIGEGARSIEAVAVYTPTPRPVTPCGACRQVLAEFGPRALVICCTNDPGHSRRYTVADLLPAAFGSDDLLSELPRRGE